MANAARAANSYVDIAEPFMEDLADKTGETVLLIQRIGSSAVCTGKVESRHPIRLSYQVGAGFPLHRGAAPAKILLAHMSPRERKAYLDRAERLEPELAKRRPVIEKELESILTRGMAQAVSEIIPDVVGMAAPVFEGREVIAALCVAGPEYRMTPKVRIAIERPLRELARELSEELSPRLKVHAP